MAGRGRFKVPSEKELGSNTTEDVQPMSLFSNYRLKKSADTSTNKDKLDSKTGSKVTSSTSISKVSQPSAAATVVKPPVPVAAVSAVSSSAARTSVSIAAVSAVSSAAARTSVSEPAAAGTSSSVSSPKTAAESTATSAPVSTTTSGSKSGTGNSIVVNFRQRGNPILKHIRNVPWEYGSIVPDYVMGKANCALFLSLRYHQLHPAYLHNRLKELGKGYDLRVLLAQVDVPDPHHILKDLAKICILADLTLILAFTPEEAGRYLESYKVYENKPAEALMEKSDTDFMSKVNDCLTTVKAVNKTDCMTLMSSFKSMEGIINASKEDLSICAGFGPHKAQRLYNVLHESFVKGRKRRSDSPRKGEKLSATSPAKKPG